MSFVFAAAVAGAIAWIYLLFFNGRFWWADQWLPEGWGSRQAWPEVVAVIPARDEAAVIGQTIAAHGKSTYPGRFSVILVDDGSRDGTAEVARSAAGEGAPDLTVLQAPPLAPGWSGKIAAQHAGLAHSHQVAPDATYVLFTDADIVLASDTLTRLVAKAETDNRVLVSLMAKLDARGLWGTLLIPAFVFFFQKLYPFPRVNDPRSAVAGAAGGCMLARREVFERQGGFEVMHSTLIDDCTFARVMKGQPPERSIWLGLTRDVISLRDNRAIGSVWNMVARTAYAQLGHSPLLLAGTVIGMGLVYLAGPLAALTWNWHGDFTAAAIGFAAWAGMAIAYWPTLRLYGQPFLAGFALPVAGFLYMLMTFTSAWRHWQGQGGRWKGRTYSNMQ